MGALESQHAQEARMPMDRGQAVDAYIAAFPADVRDQLVALRRTILEAAPEAQERMAYGLPTYSWHGNLVHFGAFNAHIGFYPTPTGIERFDARLAPYRSAKGSVRFPLHEPLPLDLIADIVRHRVQENRERAEPERTERPTRTGGVRADAAAAPPMTDEAIRRRTGRGWDEWFVLIDGWRAPERGHKALTAWLADEHGVDGWSAQSVAVAYERARGGRGLGERPDGYQVSASKTVPVAVEVLYRAFMDDALRPRWLPDAELRLRTATAPKTARFDWGDGATRVVVGFTPKGDAKSVVTVSHERLPDAAEAQRMKEYWRERLAPLADVAAGLVRQG
jgi:uncharacterized protein YdhG (YjbR/CyaY superfamily)/uncharacterized protein YndB with AHSA1/START domain